MLDALLKVADILLGRRDKLREADADRRRRVSVYFENVSRCLSDIATALKNEAPPQQACRELEQYSESAFGEVKVFGDQASYNLWLELYKLTRIKGGAIEHLVWMQRQQQGEMLYLPSRERDEPAVETIEEAVVKLEQAAGRFKALAVLAAASGP